MARGGPGRQRGRRAGAGLLVFLLIGAVLALGLHVVDRYTLGRTERESAAQLQRELGTPTPPELDIQGWPFLTQVARQNLRSVRVIADDLGAEGGSAVPVAHTDLVLTDVRSTDFFATMTARRAEGTARLDYADLGSLSSLPLSYAGDGRLRAEVKTTVFGAELDATVTGSPQLDVEAQAITLADPKVSVGSVDIPDVTADALLRGLLRPIPVTGLPFGLTLSSIRAEDDGLHAGVVGDEVQFRR